MRDILNEFEVFSSKEKDPVRLAQSSMKRPMPKRFYKTVSVDQAADGFQIHLDGKILKTPARSNFALPTRPLAEAVASEWDNQLTHINPDVMPLTRICNTALDGVSQTMTEVHQEIFAFAQSDLLCYRADTPEGLVALQAAHWDPYLEWAEQTYGARFVVAEGIVHVAQPQETLAAIDAALAAIHSPFALAALHVLTSLTGSVVMPLALSKGWRDAGSVWTAAHVDEDWNISQWGEDFEAANRRILRKNEFDAAHIVLSTA